MSEDDRSTSRHLRREDGDSGIKTARQVAQAASAPRLHDLLLRQLDLQVNSYKTVPAQLRGEERGYYITYNHTALIKELGEALDEVAWKPWSIDKDTFNRDAYLKELIDVFHFFMNLVLVAQTPDQSILDLADELRDLYFGKVDINKERMASGTYDGFNTKCPDCGRDIQDGIRKPKSDEWDFDGSGTSALRREAYLCVCTRVNYREVTA